MAERRVSRWYFGGLASCGAACCTHPLDLLKVHLQTQQEVKMRMMGMAMHVIRNDGFLALYNGLSASLCRQMTYSLTRFGIYETAREHLGRGSQGPPPFYQKVLLGAVGGFTGGLVGTPADLVNVRMQNDMKQPPSQRRNYSHALDGMYRVLREGRMCHIPVPAPGCAQDPPHELPGRVPGCYPLCHGNCQAWTPRLLQGLHSRCRPAHSSHHPHLCLPGTATQILWDQSEHLRRRNRPCLTPG
ncbi:mitochondrial dicarboxylate carrier isoform X3 [Melopsittacus undulatus]|uniref:mitochondrial dicarboxylate carrier isoform X3 n=1 Tax=Melopsittacus undulatus TaxID=13146 RepID=UPI00146B713A|nr:mitochondrial dicarboxylate carrier isoform X3 [Melopsittacus undulatus]